MSTGTGNSRENFSLYNVSQISWVLSEDEAPSTNVFSIVKEENQGFFLGSIFRIKAEA